MTTESGPAQAAPITPGPALKQSSKVLQMPDLALETCEFETDRLLVKEWHSDFPTIGIRTDLAAVIAAVLTESVTRTLPESWQGIYTIERAGQWMRERDEDGVTLLAVDKSSRQTVALMILFEAQAEDGMDETDVRLGYFLAEEAWGKGIASELVGGFVDWCRGNPAIKTVSGGVAVDNPASIRVLEKNGFKLVGCGNEVSEEDQLFRLRL